MTRRIPGSLRKAAVAHSSYRVMPTAMATGQTAGVCAALAARTGRAPRAVPAPRSNANYSPRARTSARRLAGSEWVAEVLVLHLTAMPTSARWTGGFCRRVGPVQDRPRSAAAADAVSARASPATGTNAGPHNRLLMRSAHQLAVPLRRSDLWAAARQGMQPPRWAGPGWLGRSCCDHHRENATTRIRASTAPLTAPARRTPLPRSLL
ncbi:MAG: hypothetical protein JWR37_2711 [Mycobacterium sp.]|nr:hypothetical protein [Mycobacterium sp.]